MAPFRRMTSTRDQVQGAEVVSSTTTRVEAAGVTEVEAISESTSAPVASAPVASAQVASAQVASAPGAAAEFVLVVPPLPVRLLKRLVESLRHGAPWLLRIVGPIKAPLSRLYYGWVNRHERLSPSEAERRKARLFVLPAATEVDHVDHVGVARRACREHIDACRSEVIARRWHGRLDDVVQVIGTLGPGGAERQLVTLARGAAARGPGRFRSLTMRRLSGVDAHHRAALKRCSRLRAAVPTELGPAMRWLRRRDFGFALDALPQPMLADLASTLRALQRLRPDVVHTWLDWTNVTAGVAALLLPVRRIVLSTRNVAPHHFPRLYWPFYHELYRMLLEDARVVPINNSAAGAADYAAWLDVPAERFRVVRNGIDVEAIRHPTEREIATLRRDLGVTNGAPVVVGIFRLDEEKAPLEFVAVAARVLDEVPDATVLLAGDGAMAGEVRRAVADGPRAARFRILGARSDVPAILAASDLCLLCSHHEGTPNVLIEAQHLGRPVVATRVGGTPETLEHGVTGLLRDAGDVDGLAQDVVALLRDEDRRRAMGAAAPALIADRFGIDRMVRETIACYE